MTIASLLDRVESLARSGLCNVEPDAGTADHPPLPADLSAFHGRFSEVTLFPSALFPLTIVAPSGVRQANLALLGESYSEDRSSTWYIVAKASEQFVTIDLSEQRLGRCYDSFWDTHAVAGSCNVIANSFAEFLERAIRAEGRHFYWCEPDFNAHGDAYD